MMTEAQGLGLELDGGVMIRKTRATAGGHDMKGRILTEGGERVKRRRLKGSGGIDHQLLLMLLTL